MKAVYRPATKNDIGECLNFLPNEEGCVQIVAPTKNAVIVQLFERMDEEGALKFERIVSIECKDDQIYSVLKSEALKILIL